MNKSKQFRWAWAAAALVSGSAFAQEPPLPQPAPPMNDQQVVPAIVLPPTPAIPAPVYVPPTASEIETVGHRGARLQRPVAIPPNSMMPMSSAPVAWPNLSMPATAPTSTAPQWRWYGWGAANAAGYEKPGKPADSTLNALPAPTPASNTPATTPKTTTPHPPTGLLGDTKIPEPSWNLPPKKSDATQNVTQEPSAPVLTPPSLDMQLPSSRTAPTSVPVQVEPWTGIAGPGAKAPTAKNDVVIAASNWKTARASSK